MQRRAPSGSLSAGGAQSWFARRTSQAPWSVPGQGSSKLWRGRPATKMRIWQLRPLTGASQLDTPEKVTITKAVSELVLKVRSDDGTRKGTSESLLNTAVLEDESAKGASSCATRSLRAVFWLT